MEIDSPYETLGWLFPLITIRHTEGKDLEMRYSDKRYAGYTTSSNWSDTGYVLGVPPACHPTLVPYF
jgi:hypothetical protein